MLRIQELPDGVFSVAGDTTEYLQWGELPEWVRNNLELLRACDKHTKLDDIGWHVGPTTYWIYEPGDDKSKIDIGAAMMAGIEQNATFNVWRKT